MPALAEFLPSVSGDPMTPARPERLVAILRPMIGLLKTPALH